MQLFMKQELWLEHYFLDNSLKLAKARDYLLGEVTQPSESRLNETMKPLTLVSPSSGRR